MPESPKHLSNPWALPARFLAIALVAVVALCLGAAISPASATVLDPDYSIQPGPVVRNAESGRIEALPFTVLVRADVDFAGIALASPPVDSRLRLERVTVKGDRVAAPEGYRVEHYRILGATKGWEEGFELAISVDGEQHVARYGTELAALSGPQPLLAIEEPPRLDPGAFPRVFSELSPPTRVLDETGSSPLATTRTIQVTGRILFRLPGGGALTGAQGVTVKVMEPVVILDDNTLGQGVTDLNGDIDFSFAMDGTKDIYIRIEAANDTTVNVGTGLFFTTYARFIRYNQFSGTLIDFGSLWWDDSSNFNEAIWLTHAITNANLWARDVGYDLDRVHVRYPDDSQPTSWYSPLGGTEGIHLRMDRVWRTSTLYHEYGHHFVYQQASAISPIYCNGLCEPDVGCGHCYWCEENAGVAWSEGFPHWLAWLMKRDHADTFGWGLPDFWVQNPESIQVCLDKGTIEPGPTTEGLFTSFLIDLVDNANENDPAVDPLAWDSMTIDPAAILEVATGDRPQTSWAFVEAMRNHLETEPGYTDEDVVDYWQTVRNNGLGFDTQDPEAPLAVTSPTHPVGVSSASNMPLLLVTRGADDFSGVQGHYVTMTPNNPAEPDGSGQEFPGSAVSWNTPLAPGNWYANVRSVDGSGNRSTGWISYGPMVVAPPVPINFAPIVDYLWEAPLVVRNTPDATGTSAGWPSELLPGDVYVNTLFANTSLSGAAVDSFYCIVHFDGDLQEAPLLTPGVVGGQQQFHFINRGPFTLTPGRHRVTMRLDGWDRVAELVETDNIFGYSVVVRPDVFAAGPWQDMGRPPAGTGGNALLPAAPDNMDGIRFTPANTFGAVMLDLAEGETRGSDYYLRAYQPSTGPLDGFEDPLAVSSNSTSTAMIVVSRSGSASGGFDFGIQSAWGGLPYRLRAVDSVPTAKGVETVLNWAPEDELSLLEFDFGPGDLGYFNVTVTAEFDSLETSQYVKLTWHTEADTAVAISGYSLGSTGRDGFYTRDFQIVGEGKYCVALKRDTFFGRNASAATIRVATHTSPLPEVNIPTEDPIWPAAMIPSFNFTQDETLMFPEVLQGEASATWLNFSLINSGPGVTLNAPVRVYIGSESVLDLDLGPLQPGQRVEYRHPSALWIQGGRRTLGLVVDPDELVGELNEKNNLYALQWGWTGNTLSPGQAVTRPHPPSQLLWWSFVPDLYESTPQNDGEDGPATPLNYRAPNCDGLRLDPAMAAGGINWHGVAVMPDVGENVDLSLFQGGVPAALAYVDPIAGSHTIGSGVEFALVNLGAGAGGVFDAGVYGVTGNDDYVIEAAAATPLGNPDTFASYGPFGMDAGGMLDLHEIELDPGTYQFWLLNQSGEGFFGLSVHPPLSPAQQPFQGRDDLDNGVVHGIASEAGDLVMVPVVVRPGEGGAWCIAVWKATADDLLLNLDYELQVYESQAFTPCIDIDGVADANYGPPLAIQTLPTGFGDSDLGLIDQANGSELDQLFVKAADGMLYVMIAGNLESNLNDLEIFLDTKPGGQSRLLGTNVVLPEDALGRMGDDGSGNGLIFDYGFKPDYYVTLSCGETPTRLQAYMAELPTNGGGAGYYLGSTTPASTGLLFGPAPETQNPFRLRATIDNSNIAGVLAGQGGNPDPETVVTGVELAIPLAAIGDPENCIQLSVFINGQLHDYVSNQSLPSMPPGTGNLAEPRDVNFATIPGDQFATYCLLPTVGVGDDRPAPQNRIALLHAPTPNPFLAGTTLSFSLAAETVADIEIFDIRGRRVRHLVRGATHGVGNHAVRWDGRDDTGAPVASGVYLSRLSGPGFSTTQRMILTR